MYETGTASHKKLPFSSQSQLVVLTLTPNPKAWDQQGQEEEFSLACCS